MTRTFALTLLESPMSIVRLPPDTRIPDWARGGDLLSISRTRDELSIVAVTNLVPDVEQRSDGWRAFRVEGPFDFSEIGVIAALSQCIASAGISLFVISTWDTDYVLVRRADLESVVAVLETAGHSVSMQQNGDRDV